jgi:hypothetical protein
LLPSLRSFAISALTDDPAKTLRVKPRSLPANVSQRTA